MSSPSGWHRKRPTPADAQRRKEYDSPEYRATRKALSALIAAGKGYCWRCGRYLPPGSRWDTGHDDDNRSIIRGVECRPCNRRTAAAKGARTTNSRRQPQTRTARTSRRWQ